MWYTVADFRASPQESREHERTTLEHLTGLKFHEKPRLLTPSLAVSVVPITIDVNKIKAGRSQMISDCSSTSWHCNLVGAMPTQLRPSQAFTLHNIRPLPVQPPMVWKGRRVHNASLIASKAFRVYLPRPKETVLPTSHFLMEFPPCTASMRTLRF